jgi:ribosome biogenesis GTPase
VGSSGSGKSTLTNVLLGEETRPTQEVRTGDQRGRHTTTDRRLFLVPGGGVVIDTPGLREIGVLGDESGLDAGFPEIAELAGQCRFADCSHEHEPGCAVLTALEAGKISRERYASYLKQRKELAYAEDRQEALRRKEDRHKSISREIRRFYKNRR